ncbi:MAG: NAD-dependent epimerase/dehydratase family protein [Calditrichaceae bacterium]|jgi:nucleoside-diphosphate-sugar epimerase
MKVFLTGATGFIGSFLAENLVKKGYQVKCLVRSSSNLRWISDLDIECYYGNLNNPESLFKGLYDADYIYHLAGVTKSLKDENYINANIKGTKNLIDAILATNKKLKRLIHVSSMAAVGPSPTIEPIDETHPPNPINIYGRTKLEAENYVRQYFDKIPTTIVRPPAVFGPRDEDVLQFFNTIKYGIIPKTGGRDKYLSLIYVKDLVEGIILAGENKKAVGQIYHLSPERPISWGELANIALKILNKRGFNISVPMVLIKGATFISELTGKLTGSNPALNWERYEQMKPDFWVSSSQKAKKDIGFSAKTKIHDSVKETLEWYVKQGWL